MSTFPQFNPVEGGLRNLIEQFQAEQHRKPAATDIRALRESTSASG